jgi:hypothetical protein
LDDVDSKKGVRISKRAKRLKYANFSLTPLAATIKFDVLNKNGQYSEGSGTALEDVLKFNRKIRIKSGYKLSEDAGDVDTALTLNAANAFYFFTKNSGGSSVPDVTNAAAETDTHFTDIFDINYDGGLYGGATYTPSGYYIYKAFDTSRTEWFKIKEFQLTANGTAGTIFYRTYNTIEEADEQTTSDAWTNAGATINGTRTISVDSDDRYIDIAVIFNIDDWSSTFAVSAITVTTLSFIEFIYTDVFYLDVPQQVDPANGFSIVRCSGRNIWKKAVETDINVEDLSGGVAVDQLIKDIADKVNIQYSATSIADLSSFSNRTLATGYGDTVKVEEVFEDIMTIIQDSYQMYMEYDETIDDNILFVQLKPTTFDAQFVLHFNKYQSATKKKDYGRLLQRITVLDTDAVVEKEEELDSEVAQSSTGAQIFTWSGEAIYKRITFTTSADGFTAVIDNVSNERVDFTVTATGGGGTWTARVFGNKIDGAAPTGMGEAVNSANMLSDEGITARLTNPLVLSDAEAETIAEGFVSAFGDPVFQMNVIYPYLNLLLEINDQTLIWAKNLFTDDLFIITGYDFRWAETNDSTTFHLEDSGRDFGDEGGFIYDRDALGSVVPAIGYDKGFIYDMVFGVDGVLGDVAESKYIHNISFS